MRDEILRDGRGIPWPGGRLDGLAEGVVLDRVAAGVEAKRIVIRRIT